jgi:hypothetical protein
LPKYHYKPVLEVIQEMYKKNAGTEYKPSIDIEANVRVVIEADSQDAADNSRIGFIDIRMWELDKVED